jgi:hypothetical protein
MQPFTILVLEMAAFTRAAKLQGLTARQNQNWTVGQTVQTTSGPVNGHAAGIYPQVSEYLGIPFAQPAIGDLRFAPPEKYTGNSTINGTNYVGVAMSDQYRLLVLDRQANDILVVPGFFVPSEPQHLDRTPGRCARSAYGGRGGGIGVPCSN